MERQERLLDLIRRDLCSRARGCPDVSLSELLGGRSGFEPLVNILESFGHVSLVDVFGACIEADDEYREACGYKSDLDDEIARLEVEKSDLEREFRSLSVEVEEIKADLDELCHKSDRMEQIKGAFDDLVIAAAEIRDGAPTRSTLQNPTLPGGAQCTMPHSSKR